MYILPFLFIPSVYPHNMLRVIHIIPCHYGCKYYSQQSPIMYWLQCTFPFLCPFFFISQVNSCLPFLVVCFLGVCGVFSLSSPIPLEMFLLVASIFFCLGLLCDMASCDFFCHYPGIQHICVVPSVSSIL